MQRFREAGEKRIQHIAAAREPSLVTLVQRSRPIDVRRQSG